MMFRLLSCCKSFDKFVFAFYSYYRLSINQLILTLTNMFDPHNHQGIQDRAPDADKCSDLDIFQMLSSALVSIAKSQQILQCMREVIVSDHTFTPMTLFKYLAGSSNQLTRKNIIAFLDENNLVSNDHQTDEVLKKVFQRYGINSNNGIQYTAYLHFLYPYNSGILRDLLNVKVKKYPQIDRLHKNSRPSDSIITGFLLLLQEQVKVEKRIQAQINDNRFPGKQRLKKAIKSIKKASQKATMAGVEKAESQLSMAELRNFIKAFIEVEDHLFLDLGRRLGLNKSGSIPLQNLQNILRKNRKYCGKQLNEYQVEGERKSEFTRKDQQKSNQKKEKYAKQMSFKEELYKQLASTMKSNYPVKNKTPRARSAPRNSHPSNKNRTPNKKISFNHPDLTGLDNHHHLGELEVLQKHVKQSLRLPHSKNLKQNSLGVSHVKKAQNVNLVLGLFKDFTQLFLKGHKQIERCRQKLTAYGPIDYLGLFKTLDNSKGVVDASGLQKLYTKISGIPTDFDFQLLVERFAQPEQKWLSYSQFTDIFRSSASKDEGFELGPQQTHGYHEINGIKIQPEAARMLSQIIYLTLDLEFNLKKILKKFKRQDIEYLFSRINIDSESKGFINYQQLKRFLVQDIGLSISMIDLMSLLKRLDKSKNGVVVKEQFLIC